MLFKNLWLFLYRFKMLKVLGLHSKLIRPLIGSNLVCRMSPVVSTAAAGLNKRDFHVTPTKLGGGDHEFIV